MKRIIKSVVILTLLVSFIGCEQEKESSVSKGGSPAADSTLTLQGSGN